MTTDKPVLKMDTDTSSFPLVSCIMPTADRARFIPSAIQSFLRQTYAEKELIIVDDGDTPVADLVSDYAFIRYLRCERRLTIGEKRNMACEAARGDIIAHFDDDDWSASWRLKYQVNRLRMGTCDICGLDRIYFYDIDQSQAWIYEYPAGQRPWIAGGTFVYKKAFWQRHPFVHTDNGEDTRFVWDDPVPNIKALCDSRFFIGCIHSKNTSPKRRISNRWMLIPLSRIVTITGELWPSATEPEPPGLLNAEEKPFDSEKPLVAVSIPFYKCRTLLRRAVVSILNQTYTNLILVVVNDGDLPPWEVLDDIKDSRLFKFDLDKNHGRYFADAVVLEAVRADYFLVQDADDWSAPDRIAVLLDTIMEKNAIGAVSPNRVYRDNKETELTERFDRLTRPLTPELEHRCNHFGLFSREGLLSIGGYYGGFHIGYDTLLMSLLCMTGIIACTEQPLYHRTMRRDSLTSSKTTGYHSQARARVRQDLQHLYDDAFRQYKRYCSGTIQREVLCRRLKEISHRFLRPAEKSALESAVGQLKQCLDKKRASDTQATVEPSIILDAIRRSSDWAMDYPSLFALKERLEIRRPKRILEAGSGVSTLLLAAYCKRYGATLQTLEHDLKYYNWTKEMLHASGLSGGVTLTLAEMRQSCFEGGRNLQWYDADLQGDFDFVLIDGPPEQYGRQAAFFAVQPHLATDWELMLHDGTRAHETECIRLWEASFPEIKTVLKPEGKGYVLVSGTAPLIVGSRTDLSRVGITLLTGGRLSLFRKTIFSLQASCGELLKRAKVCVLINGPDRETTDYVNSLPFVDRIITSSLSILPIGTATSFLMEEICKLYILDFVLHLEDDWEFNSLDSTWLSRSIDILNHHAEAGQVRLRYRREPVLTRHMVTHEPITWQRQCGFLIAASAHFTFNPFLIRAVDIPKIFPCTSEYGAQENFLRTGLATVQLLQGVFKHLGEHWSRRLELGRK